MCVARTLKKWLLMPIAGKYVRMPGRSFRGKAPMLTDDEKLIAVNCRQHIDMLATTIGERHFGCPAKLDASLGYIGNLFQNSRYSVQPHEFRLPEGLGVNLVATKPGKSKRVFIVGAHYDSVPGSPGANDNGSGTAALLELARIFADVDDLDVTLRFVAFGNEEHVGAPAEHMGSYLYAQECRRRGEDIVGAWSLETIGCFTDEPDSQHYPKPFDLFYPTVGNFVAFVGNEKSKRLVHDSLRAFRAIATLPSEGVAAPDRFKDIGRSDHWGFWQFDYDALMITDTANFRYAPYHTAGDTADRLNYASMARLTSGLAKTIRKLAQTQVVR